MKLSRFATNPDDRHVVFVPGLCDLLREAAQVPRPIRLLLERGDGQDLDPATYHSRLLFGQALPAAALSRCFDRPDDTSGTWLRADPVGLTPDLGAVWLESQAGLPPDSAAARELVERFAEEGMRLDLCGSGRGYLALQDEPECRFSPPWQLAGESMDRVWPEGPDALYWRHLLNETQMILHQHRQSNTDLPGSLWFWGAGSLPAAVVPGRVRGVHATSPELQGAALWAGLEVVQSCPDAGLSAGALVEWRPDHALSADDNLARLAELLGAAVRRLRFSRTLRELELAGEHRAWRLSTLRAWRPW